MRVSDLSWKKRCVRETNSGSTSVQCTVITDVDKELLVDKIASFNCIGDKQSLFSLDPSLQLELTLEALKRNAGNPCLDATYFLVPHYLSTELDTIMALPMELNEKNV
ncbi:hypothetical protein OROGR_000596 [Orobanche gracilis]